MGSGRQLLADKRKSRVGAPRSVRELARLGDIGELTPVLPGSAAP